jgi:hypothetical protein
MKTPTRHQALALLFVIPQPFCLSFRSEAEESASVLAVAVVCVVAAARIRAPPVSPKGEATDSIAFVSPINYFLQKQPKNRMSSPKTT